MLYDITSGSSLLIKKTFTCFQTLNGLKKNKIFYSSLLLTQHALLLEERLLAVVVYCLFYVEV